MAERLQKIIASCGVCSRRKAEDLIRDGKVTLNGAKATIGQSADLSKDVIIVNGTRLTQNAHRYYAVNKPKGYECALKSVGGKPLVTDLVKSKERLYPAGRLDADSHGLVLLTNDGEWANKVMHPRYPLRKVYVITVNGALSDFGIELLRRGIKLDDGYRTRPAEVEVLARSKNGARLRIAIGEGKKRQVRRMIAALGARVSDLVRTEIGPVILDKLPEGSYRELTKQEILAIQKVNEKTRERVRR